MTTWGESHGPSLGATIDGCPPGIEINQSQLQSWLDKRKPGQNKYTTQRMKLIALKYYLAFLRDLNRTPIQLLIKNTDQRSKDYSEIAQTFRPGHADITYWQKYGIRDYRGGGDLSRETAARVAAGGIARLALNHFAPNIEIYGYMTQMGDQKIDRSQIDLNQINNNPWCLM